MQFKGVACEAAPASQVCDRGNYADWVQGLEYSMHGLAFRVSSLGFSLGSKEPVQVDLGLGETCLEDLAGSSV